MHPLIKNILSDLRVEVLDEFNRNFTRKAFFDRPWPARQMDTGRGTLLLVSGHMRRSLRCTASRGSLYFWAMYYKNVPAKGATGKSAARKSRTAEYYRGMALTKKKAFTIPQRQVVGDHPTVGRIVRDTCDRNLREWTAKNLDPKFTKMNRK